MSKTQNLTARENQTANIHKLLEIDCFDQIERTVTIADLHDKLTMGSDRHDSHLHMNMINHR